MLGLQKQEVAPEREEPVEMQISGTSGTNLPMENMISLFQRLVSVIQDLDAQNRRK